jgi:hypothetical protein
MPDSLAACGVTGDGHPAAHQSFVFASGAKAGKIKVMRKPDEVWAISLRRASKQERMLYAKNNS